MTDLPEDTFHPIEIDPLTGRQIDDFDDCIPESRVDAWIAETADETRVNRDGIREFAIDGRWFQLKRDC